MPICTMLEEAEKRDHRRIGKDMDLFHIQEEAAGTIFWHPKGWKLYRTLEDYIRRRMEAAGYQRSAHAAIGRPQLVGRSGHWDKYRENMFIADGGRRGQNPRAETDELPLPCADFQPGPEILPRSAAAHGRIRRLPPL